jgi:hypothetical protein
MPDFHVIPSIDELRKRPAVRALEVKFGATATVNALRVAAGEIRRAISSGAPSVSTAADAVARIEAAAATILGSQFAHSLAPVINATGVIIHTNLGRAPLAAAAIDRVATVARGYASLEYDVARGTRGRRDAHAEDLLRRLTGAELGLQGDPGVAARDAGRVDGRVGDPLLQPQEWRADEQQEGEHRHEHGDRATHDRVRHLLPPGTARRIRAAAQPEAPQHRPDGH